MENLNGGFYFIHTGEVILGPYPLERIIEWLRVGKITLATRISVDKTNWASVADILRQNGVEMVTPAGENEGGTSAADQPMVEVRRATKTQNQEVGRKKSLIEIVMGLLWRPDVHLPLLAGREKQSLGIVLGYQSLLALLVCGCRWKWVLHRATAWRMLGFVPLEIAAVWCVVAVVWGIWIGGAGKEKFSFAVMLANGMTCGTFGMTLFALCPAHFPPWHYAQVQNVVFAVLSFTGFSISTAAAMRLRGAFRKSDKFFAGVAAAGMMLGVTVLFLSLIALYKEF